MKRLWNTKSCVQIASLISLCAMMGISQPQERADDTLPHGSKERGPLVEDRHGRPGQKVLDIRIDADALRARLRRSVARAQKTIELHTSALAKLDEGASPTEVLAEIKIQGFSRNANKLRAPGSRGDQSAKQAPKVRLSTKDREEMHKLLKRHFPDLWMNLDLMAKMDPQSADRLLERMAPRFREILLLQETQSDLADHKIEEMQVGLMFVEASRIYKAIITDRSTADSERAQALLTLREVAAKRFDVQLKAKQHEISKLEARLNELKSSIDTLSDRREDEINRMITTARKAPHKPARAKRKKGVQPRSGND